MKGDSGGPLTFQQNGQHVLIGDTSRAAGCATVHPLLGEDITFFGRVSFFRDWIEDKMSKPTFCGGTADAAAK